MKKIILFLFLFCVILLGCSGNVKKDFYQEKEIEKNKENTVLNTQEIISFFESYLKGNKKLFKNEQIFDFLEINSLSQEVWKAWVQANSFSARQRLPFLKALSKTEYQWELPFQEVTNPTVMPFWYGSRGEKPSKGYPLFMYIHGSGDKIGEFESSYHFSNQMTTTPSVHFAPQIPNEGQWYRWWQKSKQWAWENLLREVFLSEEIDSNRIYFLGISEGGYGSQRLASFYADYLAGAGPMAGGEPLKNAPAENCQHIAFSLRTGSNDTQFFRNVLTKYTKEEFERLKALYPNSADRKIEILEGYGHGIPYYETPQWLKNYSRNPYPKQFVWEDFEMDGRYRNGFYNLVVKERPSLKRTRYQVNIVQNEVNIQVEDIDYQTTETKMYGSYPIETKFSKKYTSVTSGKIIVYLNNYLVNLNDEIAVVVNGKKAFKGKVMLKIENLVNSCATFFDSKRIYPASIEIDISTLK